MVIAEAEVWIVRFAAGLRGGEVYVRRRIGVVEGVWEMMECRRKVEGVERTEVMRVSWCGVVRAVWRRGMRDIVGGLEGRGCGFVGRRDGLWVG